MLRILIFSGYPHDPPAKGAPMIAPCLTAAAFGMLTALAGVTLSEAAQ